MLLYMISRKIKDERFLSLISCVLDHYNSDIPKKGMPLGNWTSQFFANVYLNELDQFIKQKLHVLYYIRYVDDFVFIDSSKERLEQYEQEIRTFLTTISLELHETKTQIIPLGRGLNFLGYRIFYHQRLLRKKNVWKIKHLRLVWRDTKRHKWIRGKF